MIIRRHGLFGRYLSTTSKKPLVVAILGLTNSGKSNLSLKLAKQLNGEIISCDSMTIFRELGIFTCKPTLYVLRFYLIEKIQE